MVRKSEQTARKALLDGVFTCAWVVITSVGPYVVPRLAAYLGVTPTNAGKGSAWELELSKLRQDTCSRMQSFRGLPHTPPLRAANSSSTYPPPQTASLFTVLLLVLADPVFRAWGSPLVNPSQSAAFVALGQGSARHHLTRVAAQAAGAALGARISHSLAPAPLKSGLPLNLARRGGDVSLLHGMGLELVLCVILNVLCLTSEAALPVIGRWVPTLATFAFFQLGAATGPGMNPAITLGWAAAAPAGRGHGLLEHVLVYWWAPLWGGVVAALLLQVGQVVGLHGAAEKRSSLRRAGGAASKEKDL
jgi:glycerol uptake facilitator-like aquaporin